MRNDLANILAELQPQKSGEIPPLTIEPENSVRHRCRMYFLDEGVVDDTTEKDVTIKEKGWSLEYAIKVQEYMITGWNLDDDSIAIWIVLSR